MNTAVEVIRQPDEFSKAEEASNLIHSKTAVRPQIALILGSGLGAFADSVIGATRLSYADIPHFPRTSAAGHAGKLVLGTVSGVSVVAMQGRVHYYEGLPLRDVIFPMRVFSRLGVKSAIITNAAGGINTSFSQGALMVLSDHINMQGSNPLIGPNDERFGPRALGKGRQEGHPADGVADAVPHPQTTNPRPHSHVRFSFAPAGEAGMLLIASYG